MKKIVIYHLLPATIATLILLIYIRAFPFNDTHTSFPGNINNTHSCATLPHGKLNGQMALSVSLKRKIPVLLGSSELSASHLEALSHNFFTNKSPGIAFFSLGHQGFQCLAMLTVLAANRPLIKNSKITIILSPGWFEEQYCKGTSLPSFFEYASPAYLYTIYKDSLLDEGTKSYINNYISRNFDKISKPDALLRLMGKKADYPYGDFVNTPFLALDKIELNKQEQIDIDLQLQEIILESLNKMSIPDYNFPKIDVNWDSLILESTQKFKGISNNNSLSVENNYYNKWLKNKPLKNLVAVAKEYNQEYKDFVALANFLKTNGCDPLFVIMPLNKKAHKDLKVLMPIVRSIKLELEENDFKLLDMYSPNVLSYQDGVMEDIMHPYNAGWYQIDKYIYENYHD